MNTDFDFHIHSQYSDGELSIPEIIDNLKQNNIKKFAITDHDNFDAINELKKTDLKGLDYIKGIEINTILDNHYKLHMLDFNFDEKNQKLINVIKQLKEARKIRFKEIVEALKEKHNITFREEDINGIINNANIPGKPHLAKLMVKDGIVPTVYDAFEEYLVNIKVKTKNRVDAEIIFPIIKESGGISIWAHPKKVEKKYDIDMQEIIPRLIEIGLDGVEIYNSIHSLSDCQRYQKIAKEYNLKTSGGSDFHGPITKPNVQLGLLFNSGEDYKPNITEINII